MIVKKEIKKFDRKYLSFISIAERRNTSVVGNKTKGAVMQTHTYTKEERMEYIGASDIAAVMNKSRWTTPLKLWLEKRGETEPKDLSKNKRVELGTELEDFVAQKFSRETGKKVMRTQKDKLYRHDKYPFLATHTDRLIVGTDELLECKTCAEYKVNEWADDEIPEEYILQVMWELGITGRKVGYIAVLIGTMDFKHKKIEFDEELFNIMVEAAKDFWHRVKNNIPPLISADDNKILFEMYPKNSEDLLEKQELETKIGYLTKIKTLASKIKSKQEKLENEIKFEIGERLGITTNKFKVTWTTQESTLIDGDLIREKLPEIAQEYSKKSSKRVFKIHKNKERTAA